MYNIFAFDYKLGIIYFLILFFLLIMCKNITNTSIEGFNANDITSIAGKVTDIASKAGEIPGKITDIGNQITGAASGITGAIDTKISALEEKIMSEVQDKIDAVKDGVKTDLIDPITEQVDKAKDQITDIFGKIDDIFDKIAQIPGMIQDKIDWLIGKIKNMGKNIGIIVKKGIIRPLGTFFQALLNVFVQLFDILKKIVGKIKILPGCSILYIYKTIYSGTTAFIEWIIPSFILDFISTVYSYTLKIPLEYILNKIISWLGWDVWWDDCFKLEADENIDSIKDGFQDSFKEFKTSFGNMDFSDIFNSNFEDEEEKDDSQIVVDAPEDAP